ncbi:RNA polymerase sigma-54 factor [Desulfovibrio desulfuricans]|uniref:RNA polymerase sigma-54 factor n=1 Tax=Desulfovibrio desulfuricans TaxID=876 RepID=A0A4P7UHH3_DESDE|nr:RNA polymerase factor sigma-54 [Desulfovibrio desulfuricans]QCC85703.1 RNA polymerase sigma-54 factor [Desulfovibrio desulfuricans]
MALELRQQLKLTQQLVMTPQLQQAIKLLQLSRVELLETVQQELLENPFLEESTINDDASAEQPDDREGPKEEVYDKELAKDADWEDYLGEFASTPRLSQSREFELAEEISPLEARYAAKPTLDGHLLWQLRLSDMTEEQKGIGEIIIGNLSSAGYLQATLDEVADMAKTTPDAVLPVLEKLQRFDPVGVAARDARECLMVQIKSLNYARDPILVELVEAHLEDLEAKRYKPLLRKFKLDMDELKEYLDIIQSLDPLPGASFGGGEPTYVSPDVFVYKMGDEFVILLNDDGLPQLQLSAMSQMNIGGNEQEKDYCSEKIRSASWLIKSLYQRQRTLYKVMESIVRHQQPFFEDGVTKLAPLILKDIADDISMHESTVSRITTNKYVATPHGIFELKFFFNSGLELDDGSQVGSESVKALIKKFISEEDTRSPLSDERIGEMLKERLKVNIARRTVAKYRTALDIPSSSRRKDHF